MDEKDEKKVMNISTMAYDLNAINDFIFQANKVKNKTSEITDSYERNSTGDMVLKNRTMKENKNEATSDAVSIRYSLVSMLLDRVNNILMEEYYDYDEDEIEERINKSMN